MTFILPESRCHLMFNRFSLASVMKLWVAPESTIVLLVDLWFTQVSTYIRTFSIGALCSSVFFWSANRNLRAPIRGVSLFSYFSASSLSDFSSESTSASNAVWKACNCALFGHSYTLWFPLHRKQNGAVFLHRKQNGAVFSLFLPFWED